jgi:hypothetical protein
MMMNMMNKINMMLLFARKTPIPVMLLALLGWFFAYVMVGHHEPLMLKIILMTFIPIVTVFLFFEAYSKKNRDYENTVENDEMLNVSINGIDVGEIKKSHLYNIKLNGMVDVEVVLSTFFEFFKIATRVAALALQLIIALVPAVFLFAVFNTHEAVDIANQVLSKQSSLNIDTFSQTLQMLLVTWLFFVFTVILLFKPSLILRTLPYKDFIAESVRKHVDSPVIGELTIYSKAYLSRNSTEEKSGEIPQNGSDFFRENFHQ